MTLLLTGLALGIVYGQVGVAVTAVGLATRTLHLAIGPVLVVGVLLRLYLEAAGMPVPVAILGGLLAGAALSALLEPAVLAPLGRRAGGDRQLLWLVGLAVAAALIEAVSARWLATRQFRPRSLLGVVPVGVLPRLPPEVLVAIAVGLPAALGLAAALQWTRWGRRLRLVGGAPEAAALAGVSPAVTRVGALAVSGAVAVLAGLLVAPITFVGVGQGAGFTVRGVAAAALLGFGGPLRALAAGLLLGLVEAGAQSVSPRLGGDLATGILVLALLCWRGGELRRAWGRPW